MVHDSFWSAVFPENQRALLNWPPKVPCEAQLQLQKFMFIFKMIIMTRKILKTKITKKVSSEESVNAQELEETMQKKKHITKHGTSCSLDFARVTAGELSLTIPNFFGGLTM